MQLYAGDHLSHRGGRRYLKRIHNYAPQLFSACWLLLRGRMLPMKKDRATFILVTRPLALYQTVSPSGRRRQMSIMRSYIAKYSSFVLRQPFQMTWSPRSMGMLYQMPGLKSVS